MCSKNFNIKSLHRKVTIVNEINLKLMQNIRNKPTVHTEANYRLLGPLDFCAIIHKRSLKNCFALTAFYKL